MEKSDEMLVRDCRDGDEAAWEALIMRYQRLIYSISRRAGLNDELSAEVFQIVFTGLFEQLDRIEQPAKLRAWLVTRARRETWRIIHRENVQRSSAHVGIEDDAAPNEVADGSPLADETLSQLEEQHLVRRALQMLDERCRTLLILLFYQSESSSYSDIALTLGISEGSIGPTRARCLKKLRQELDKLGF